MLEQPQRTLNDDVLENGTRRNVDCGAFCRNDDDSSFECNTAAKVDRTGDGQVVKLNNLGDRRNAVLEAGNLLEVAAELDERSRAEAVGVNHKLAVLQGVQIGLDEHEVGAGLDGQETLPGDIDTVSALEVLDGSTDSGLELEDRNMGLALLGGRERLDIGYDLDAKLVLLNNTLDGLDIHPDVVSVEVLELFDGLELVYVLLRNLRDFKKTDGALVINDGTTLDIGLCLISQLHDVLSLGVNHVLQDAEIDDSTQVVGVGKENGLNDALD